MGHGRTYRSYHFAHACVLFYTGTVKVAAAALATAAVPLACRTQTACVLLITPPPQLPAHPPQEQVRRPAVVKKETKQVRCRRLRPPPPLT